MPQKKGSAVRSFRPVEGSGSGSPKITLEQARAAAERSGIDLSCVDLCYEPPTAPGYRPGYGYTALNSEFGPYVNPAGRYEITLQNPALQSERDAVMTIAHEIEHLKAAIAGGNPFDHAAAEAVAEEYGRNFIP